MSKQTEIDNIVDLAVRYRNSVDILTPGRKIEMEEFAKYLVEQKGIGSKNRFEIVDTGQYEWLESTEKEMEIRKKTISNLDIQPIEEDEK